MPEEMLCRNEPRGVDGGEIFGRLTVGFSFFTVFDFVVLVFFAVLVPEDDLGWDLDFEEPLRLLLVFEDFDDLLLLFDFLGLSVMSESPLPTAPTPEPSALT